MKFLSALPLLAALMLSGCHGQPVVDTTPKASVGGTIAGIVSSDANAALANRKVTATERRDGNQGTDAMTATNGGYTIKVPEGTYKLEVELHEGEAVAKQPDQTHINNSDLDPHRDFVITVKRAG